MIQIISKLLASEENGSLKGILTSQTVAPISFAYIIIPSVISEVLCFVIICSWVEFAKRSVAKRVAKMLNNEQIGIDLNIYHSFV